ncbi:UPF0276 protein [Dyella lipolytica]|uniref:UPF0276 protein ISP13_13965 n=1 Tax=Dyella lipolytica TaxID=1867835 RepID=A0ABW8IX98_9GAMM|nr:DUF692 domain-containing protein [Dyella lipolytica]GLQ46073.1 UPF0276 protein [Dyella lipolytica]
MRTHDLPAFEGFGLGLRPAHYQEFLDGQVAVDFVEVISENFMVQGGKPLAVLEAVRARYRVAMHGVSLSIGSADGLKLDYLKQLKDLAERIQPLWISDHLCWTGVEGFNSHDLLPLPYTNEAMDVVCAHVNQVQDFLGQPILLENPSTYLSYSQADYSEPAFLAELCRRTGCYFLLDVNNIYVSGVNQGFDLYQYLSAIPKGCVRQMHLAGHSQGENRLIDTHDQPVPSAVWSVYRAACERFGSVASMIERDDNIPPLSELLDELNIARTVASAACQSEECFV